MATSTQTLDRLKSNIAQLKSKIAMTPPADFGGWFGCGQSRRSLEIECAALEELEQAIDLSQGRDVTHVFFGRCSPNRPHDLTRYIGILKAYQAQARAGMCCLVLSYIDTVNELIGILSTKARA